MATRHKERQVLEQEDEYGFTLAAFIECSCGWVTGIVDSLEEAEEMYAAHKRKAA